MKKHILLSIVFLLFCGVFTAFAQTKEVKGTVTDDHGDPLVGVSVAVVNQPGLGASTNIDGHYTIRVGQYDILEFKYLGYKTVKAPVAAGKFDIVMEEENQSLDEVVVVAAGGVAQRKITMSGAISSVEVKTLKVPTANISNALVGNVAGIIGRQTTGEPGENVTEFWVRGISTFGANDKALILVDGIERSLDQLNVEDIESFTVLKDASATAIYGSRGANGVVVITTKHGESGKVHINAKIEASYNTRSRTPEYTDGITYAEMANEASLTRYRNPVYSEQDMEIIRRNLDPDLFPNIDWQDVVIRDGSPQYRATVSFSGGGNTARYYVSGSYLNQEGMYKTGGVNRYKTNVNYQRFNYRSNVDMNITSTTLLKTGVSGYLINQIKPLVSSDDIWASIASMTPLTVPRQYSNGAIPAYGSDNNLISPEVVLNQMGYDTRWVNKAETNVTLEQDLKFIVPGLRFTGTFSFDTESSSDVYRSKNPELWYADKARNAEGNLVMNRVRTSSMMTQSGSADGIRRYYTEAKLDYSTLIADAHRISGLLMYFQQEKSLNVNISSDPRSAIPFRNVALSGRATYGYKDRYMLEYNFGYTGSENFERGQRFGFFPAYSGAYVVSEEPFIKDNIDWLDMLKIRYSYGKVGNDKLTNDERDYAKRFPYMSFIGTSTSYTYGEFNTNTIQGYRITTIGSPGLTWEKSTKNNLGIDFVLFGNSLTLTTDLFTDHRVDIFMQRNLMPYSTGLQDIAPYANIGEMDSKGIEAVGSYAFKVGELNLTLRGNFTYATTNVINYDEADNALPYQMTKGYRLNQTRGLIALGLFKDQEDIDNSPRQTFGSYLPGDIKYKDVNGDGVIDSKDEVPFGYTSVPNLVYGAGLSGLWKRFELNILVQGAGKTDFFIGGSSIYPFQGGAYGNILKDVANSENRWISREISGTEATERQDAMFPRLSYGGNDNNYRNSTFWWRDASYLRVKSIEFGYTLPKAWAQRCFAEGIRVGFIGYNLFVFSPFKWWDPEIGSSDGAKYPIEKTYTFNLTVNF